MKRSVAYTCPADGGVFCDTNDFITVPVTDSTTNGMWLRGPVYKDYLGAQIKIVTKTVSENIPSAFLQFL
jgi:hypothetical protein